MDLLAQVPILVHLVVDRQVVQEDPLVEHLPILLEEKDLPAVSRTRSSSNCEPRSWLTGCWPGTSHFPHRLPWLSLARELTQQLLQGLVLGLLLQGVQLPLRHQHQQALQQVLKHPQQVHQHLPPHHQLQEPPPRPPQPHPPDPQVLVECPRPSLTA